MKLTLFFCFKTNLCLFMNQISCQRRHFSCDDCQKEQFTTLFVDNYKNITVTTNSWNFDNKVFSQHCFVVKSANFLLIFFVVHFVFLSTIPFFEHIPIFSQTPFSHPTILVNFSFFTRSSLLFILLTTKLTSKMQSKHKHQQQLYWRSVQSLISAIISISTGTPMGRVWTPIALLAYLFHSPSTKYMFSLFFKKGYKQIRSSIQHIWSVFKRRHTVHIPCDLYKSIPFNNFQIHESIELYYQKNPRDLKEFNRNIAPYAS